jgi:hypothetical protein
VANRHLEDAAAAIDDAAELLAAAEWLRATIANTPGLQNAIVSGEAKVEFAPSGQETRVVSETGGAKGSKPSQLASVAPYGLAMVGEVCGMGAEKYDLHNYRKGYKWSLSSNALFRHVLAFLDGQDLDEESGLPHMAHAAWHAMVLVQFMRDHPDFDDRYKA